MVCGLHNPMKQKRKELFFLMGLQYLFKPHTLVGLSFQHFSFFNFINFNTDKPLKENHYKDFLLGCR